MRRGRIGIGGPAIPGGGKTQTALEAALSLPNAARVWWAPETIAETSSAVTGWSGYQGTTIALTQGTGANRPAYIESEPTLGGRACVHIDTNAKFLEELTTTGAVGTLTDASLYIAASLPNPAYNTWHFTLITADGASTQIYPASHNGSGVRECGLYDGTAHRVATTTSFGAHLWSYHFDASENECLIRIDGADFATVAYDGTLFSASTKIQVAFGGGAAAAGAKYSEIIIVPSLDDAAAVAVREAYLTEKLGL